MSGIFDWNIQREASKYPKPFRRAYYCLRHEEIYGVPVEEIKSYFEALPPEGLTPTYLDPQTGELKTYRVEFWPEYHYYRLMHMPQEEILDFYLVAGRDVIRNNDVYRKHNLTLSTMDDDTGNRKARRGSQRGSGSTNTADAENEEPTSKHRFRDGEIDLEINIHGANPEELVQSEEERRWRSLQETVYNFATYDENDVYNEDEPLAWQIAVEPIVSLLRSLSERDERIIELLLGGEKRSDIAKRMRVAASTVTHAIEKFRDGLEPIAREYHFLVTDEELERRKDKRRRKRPSRDVADGTETAGDQP